MVFARAAAVLHIHGSADVVVPYGGNAILGFPAIPTDHKRWSTRNQCTVSIKRASFSIRCSLSPLSLALCRARRFRPLRRAPSPTRCTRRVRRALRSSSSPTLAARTPGRECLRSVLIHAIHCLAPVAGIPPISIRRSTSGTSSAASKHLPLSRRDRNLNRRGFEPRA